MKRIVSIILMTACCSLGLRAQTVPKPSTSTQKATADSYNALRTLLLSQLRSTHNRAEWFFPIDTAVSDMTPEQAKWIPTNASGKINPNANHSVGMIVNHLLFWNANALAQLKGVPTQNPNTNDETFNDFNPAKWAKTVHDLDAVMNSLEELVAHADDSTLLQIAPTIEHINTHNAYHTGQIFYVRKLQGSWKQDNDVPK
jgi:hypothetical protein